MRLLLTAAILTMTFAGCVAPEQADPLFGVCPQWLDGTPQNASLGAAGRANFDADATDDRNRSLDLWNIRVDASDLSGTVELRAFATSDGRALRFTDYRDPAAPRTPTFLTINEDSGTFAVDIFLSDVTHGADVAPSGLRLETSPVEGAIGSVQVSATPAYRVCGAPLPAE